VAVCGNFLVKADVEFHLTYSFKGGLI